jgi:hypothetical protein
MKKQIENHYDIAYKTKSGRMMVAKNISGINANAAKAKLKKQMRKSSSFDSIITAVKV